MLGAKSVGIMALISISIVSLLGFLLWIQTNRLETTQQELAAANLAKATAELTIKNLQDDYSATLQLNSKLQSDSTKIRSELTQRNKELQYYIGRLDEQAKRDPASVESNTNNVLVELMQSVSTTTGGNTTKPDNNSK